MVDSGFQIQEDLLLYFCRLVVPPAARVKNQMTKPDPNLRIHVERAINRMKFFEDFRRSYTSDNDKVCGWHNINFCCFMQFEAKVYKNEQKGFAEVTGNFH